MRELNNFGPIKRNRCSRPGNLRGHPDPLIRHVAESTESRFSGPGIDSVSEFVIRFGQKCILTIGQVTRTLAPSLAYVAETSGVRIARAKKGRLDKSHPSAIGPDVRAEYEVLRNAPRAELTESLNGSSAPLEMLEKTDEPVALRVSASVVRRSRVIGWRHTGTMGRFSASVARRADLAVRFV